jgi:hypothetical protein
VVSGAALEVTSEKEKTEEDEGEEEEGERRW